jgi:hypothetical protein
VKRWLTALLALVSTFAFSSPAVALTYTWSDIDTITVADGVSGHVASGNEFSTLWQTQVVALENGKVFAFWVVSTNSVAGYAKPSTSKLYSRTFIPGIGWGTATQRYSSNTRIVSLTALKIGENSVGIAFQEETYAAGATDPSSIKVRLSSVSSPSDLGSVDTWRPVVTLADANDFSLLRTATGFGGFITVVIDSRASLNGSTSTFARRFEVANQTFTNFAVPSSPNDSTLEAMYQSPTGAYLWLYRSSTDDVFLVSVPYDINNFVASSPTKMNLGSPINHVSFTPAPTWDEPVSGALYFDDSTGASWMFMINAQGFLQSPHRIVADGVAVSGAIDGLGYFYVVTRVTNQDQSTTESLIVMKLSDYTSTTYQLEANSRPFLKSNLSGNVLYASAARSALNYGQLRGGRWVGAFGKYTWNLAQTPEFSMTGGVTEFTLAWATQDSGIRSVTSETIAPDPVTQISGQWTAPDQADFSWTPPTSDPDFLYNWSADCGTFGQQQGESRDTTISLQDVSALIGCNINVKVLQGGLESTIARWRLVPQTVAKVSNVRTRWVGPASAEVKWTASSTPGATYSVKVTANNFSQVVTTSTSSVVVNGLLLSRVYRVEVTALKFSAKSAVVSGGIAAAKKASAPRDVKFSGSANAIKLVWTAPKTNASSVYAYRVSFKVGKGKWTKLNDVTVRSISVYRVFGAKKVVQFKVEALTGYTSPAALSKARTTLAKGYL